MPFKPDIELAERMCLLFVRHIRGRDLVKRENVPAGWIPPIGEVEPVGRSKMYRRKSEDTYLTRGGLGFKIGDQRFGSDFVYDYLLSMLADEMYVRRTLTRAGMEAIDAEDTGESFRMTRYRERFLRRMYTRIAWKFRNGRLSKWAAQKEKTA